MLWLLGGLGSAPGPRGGTPVFQIPWGPCKNLWPTFEPPTLAAWRRHWVITIVNKGACLLAKSRLVGWLVGSKTFWSLSHSEWSIPELESHSRVVWRYVGAIPVLPFLVSVIALLHRHLADKPTRWQSTRWQDNSLTNQLADTSTRLQSTRWQTNSLTLDLPVILMNSAL